MEVDIIDEGDPLVSGVGRFQVFDEVYRNLDISPDSRPLLRARMLGEQDYHPVLWTHRYGAGRVVYDALGHGPDSLGDASHLEILRRATRWLVGLPPGTPGVGHA